MLPLLVSHMHEQKEVLQTRVHKEQMKKKIQL